MNSMPPLPPSDEALAHHPVVSREEWLVARQALLAKEKDYTRLRDRLAAERRALPWVKVDKDYVFDTAEGPKTLAQLFGPRSQLLVNHFMLGPGWKAGCPGCSFGADHIEAALVHIRHADVSVVAVSRAPLPEIQAYRKRMGWSFDWVSSHGSDFNYDFHVSFRPEEMTSGKAVYNYRQTEVDIEELPGLSVFYKDPAGQVFHTYSSYARGGEEVVSTFMLLDMVPKGRNEHGIMSWMRRHDEYDDAPKAAPKAASCCE